MKKGEIEKKYIHVLIVGEKLLKMRLNVHIVEVNLLLRMTKNLYIDVMYVDE
jgi:hypothetical protein